MRTMLKIKKNYPLKKSTTMAIGGPASYFIVVKNEAQLLNALKFAKQKRLKWYVVGEGSNLIAADKGFRGAVIQIRNSVFQIRNNTVIVGAGNNLAKLIPKLNRLGLGGLERMASIPGTVGGAIYGNAGAYGQEIKDVVERVRFFDGKKFRNFTKKQCLFGYRNSIFKKHKNWIITQVIVKLIVGDRGKLLKTSKEIIKLRNKKYPKNLKCPGSFFKNIRLQDIKPENKLKKLLKRIGKKPVKYGKIPAGHLLEAVGAKGMQEGGIKVALHHGNLIYNTGRGKAKELEKLSRKLKTLVKNKFGIIIEEEVEYLPH
ncbi:MAG: UDP-N-acetylenolpyruvoylglucosamine reductase [Flavobacterium sp.]|nr:UDP-N-acetylenolpyruvoylglucosamine reductase [Flavobacterium sp.]